MVPSKREKQQLPIFTALLAGILALSGCGGGGSSGGGGTTTNTGTTSVALKDAPQDDLSVLQIDVDQLDIRDSSGNSTRLFPPVGGASVTTNLLRLRDTHLLLGNQNLPVGTYDRLTLTYSNAQAIDKNGNALTINTGTSGVITVLLQPVISLGSQNSLLELDFDVNSSVTNLVTGPGGSLDINATIFAKVERQSGQKIEDFEGLVQGLLGNSFSLSLGFGNVNVALSSNTVIKANGNRLTLNSPGLNLASILQNGVRVEVDGVFDPVTNTVNATQIEIEDGQSGVSGNRYKGLVVGIGSGNISVLVSESDLASVLPGSIQTPNFSFSTQYEYDDPDGPATVSDIMLGQEVRVTVDTNNSSSALEVKLRETEIRGQVQSVNQSMLQATILVATIEKVAVAAIPGFNSTVTVQFTGSVPVAVTASANIELEGHFGRGAGGAFLVGGSGVNNNGNDDDEIEGRIFSMVSASPFNLSVTGMLDVNGVQTNSTLNVVLAPGALFVEKNKSTSTTTVLTESAFVAQINAGAYNELEAEGTYDPNSNTLTAVKLKGELP